MISVDRVLNCIKRKPVDRVPRNFTAFPEVIEKIKSYYSIEGDQSYGNPLIKCIDPRVLAKLSCDFRMIAPIYHGPQVKIEPDGSWINLFGVKRKPVKVKTGQYFSYEGTPLKNATLQEVKSYPWPKTDWFDYSSVIDQCQEFADYGIVSGFPGNVDFLNKTATLIGMENLMMGLAQKNPIVLEIFDQLAEFFYEYNRRIFIAGKGRIHIAFFGDDYGSSHNLLISPKMYKDIIMPRFKPFYDLAKSFDITVMHHSCGSIGKLLPDLIEAGVEMVDVVQPYVPHMDFQQLKENFGNQLIFHGGICVQKILPDATAIEVKKEVDKVISILGREGGYILSPTNKIGPEVPLENVLAMYDLDDEL